jgi:hypothetical protein
MNPLTGRVDVNAYIGEYPFRHIPHPDPDALVRVMDREGVELAWVGSLPAVWHRDPTAANDYLFRAIAPHASRLIPIPVVRPDWPDWLSALDRVRDANVPAVRAYPSHWQFAVGDVRLGELAVACAERGMVIVLTVRFEDLRQRHPLDAAADLTPAAVRELVRAGTRARIIVTAASRDFIEEVHWGLTPNEQKLLWWDISWIWGPPEDHLAHLFRTIGSERFVYGTAWPLRLAQTPRANIALLPDELSARSLADPRAWR